MMSAMTLSDHEFQGRPLGVRLWLADVAAGFRIHRKGSGPADRRTPRALRLFLRPSRHAGKAGPRARARPRRRLPRHRLPRCGEAVRETPSPICASREQTTNVYREVTRSVWLENEARAAGQRADLRGRSQPCAICRPAARSRTAPLSCTRATAAPATTATMCWPPSRRSRRRAFATTATASARDDAA